SHFLQVDGQARVPHGSDSSPLREEGVAGAEDHRPLLDHFLLACPRESFLDEAALTNMMNLSGKTVAVVGLGESGVAAAELALRQGAEVMAIDAAPEDELSAAARGLVGKGARLFAGRNDEAAVKRADVVVVSPGV